MASSKLGEGQWLPDPDVNDLLILGTALIRRHDKGEMTDTTIDRFVNGVKITYELTDEQAKELRQKLVSAR